MNVRQVKIIAMKTQTAWTKLVHTIVYAGQATLVMDWRVKVSYRIGLGFNILDVH